MLLFFPNSDNAMCESEHDEGFGSRESSLHSSDTSFLESIPSYNALFSSF